MRQPAARGHGWKNYHRKSDRLPLARLKKADARRFRTLNYSSRKWVFECLGTRVDDPISLARKVVCVDEALGCNTVNGFGNRHKS